MSSSRVAWTRARLSPVRTRLLAARPPTRSPSAPRMIDFPAPVSPVRDRQAGLELELQLIHQREVLNTEESNHLDRRS